MRSINRLAITVLSLLFIVGISASLQVFGQTVSDEQQIRSKVTEIGTGRDAKIEVTMRDRTKLKGYVDIVTTDSVSVVDSKTGSSQTVDFANVAKVRKPRNGLKPRTWIIIGAAAAAAIIIGKTVLYPVLCDGGAGC